jgi:TrmH family RNA methyltransferase
MAVRNAKKILALRRKKVRDAERRFVIEGIRLAEEAIRSEAPVEQLVFCREMVEGDERLTRLREEATRREILVQETDRRAFRHMGESQTPEGVLGVVQMQAWDRSQVLDSAGAFVLLDRIRDPGNLGLILRTAEAAGVGGIFISIGSVELHNPKVVRASRGSIFRVPAFRNQDLSPLLGELRNRSIQALSAHVEGAPYHRVKPDERFAIILGNETFGIDPPLAAQADASVTIPMVEGVDSLNVAVAAGILLFRFLEQRLP